MHGLINRSIQCFVSDTYGKADWAAVAADAKIGFTEFEALLNYDRSVTDAVLQAAADRFSTSQPMLLEDLGTYLVTHHRMAPIRRLLRLGGETFIEFLFSLDDLNDRARLAVLDLQLPTLELRDHFTGKFTLQIGHAQPGFGHVFVGLLRAMADDYGALVYLEHQGRRDHLEMISVDVLETDYAQGRKFALAGSA